MKDLPKTGVKYLELRMLDLDSSSSVGVRTGTLRFLRLMASYFIMTPALHPEEVEKVITRSDKMNEIVSEEEPTSVTKFQAKAKALMRRLEMYANQIQLGPEYQEELEDLEDRIENPYTTPSARLMTHVKNDSLEEYALIRAKRYQNSALETIRPFKGFDHKRKLTAEDLKSQLFKGSWEPDKSKVDK